MHVFYLPVICSSCACFYSLLNFSLDFHGFRGRVSACTCACFHVVINFFIGCPRLLACCPPHLFPSVRLQAGLTDAWLCQCPPSFLPAHLPARPPPSGPPIVCASSYGCICVSDSPQRHPSHLPCPSVSPHIQLVPPLARCSEAWSSSPGGFLFGKFFGCCSYIGLNHLHFSSLQSLTLLGRSVGGKTLPSGLRTVPFGGWHRPRSRCTTLPSGLHPWQ